MAQFPLIDQASLLMIPGAYKEGKIYSQLPTDGSGDFTYTRGTDTATRVNENGLIEKERVNLLLQSNSFDTTWVLGSGLSLTSGKSGYDGSNDAWLYTDASTGNSLGQSCSTSGVQTLSVYVKAGTANGIRFRRLGGSGGNSYFNISDSSTEAYNTTNTIQTKKESIGNGWYRISIVFNDAVNTIRFYVGDGSTTSSTTGSIYIQDAQLEQGLVATDYIETTTAPVYAGLTDNMPRLDYTDATCPSLLLEPSRSNRIPHSEYYDSFLNYGTGNAVFEQNVATSPENVENAYKIILNSGRTSGGGAVSSWTGAFTQGESINFSIFLKADEFDEIQLGGFFADEYAIFNLRDGSVISQASNVTNAYSVPFGNDWYRCVVTYTFQNSIGNNFLYSGYKVLAKSNGVSLIGDGVKGVLAYGAQFEQGSYPTSYIPTYGSSQTRAADVSSVTKAVSSEGSLFINVGGTSQPKLSVLGEYFDASTTENKVAIAYSSTALVISHNGSIVVDKTGTYDVSSLTQIQLGHSNGSDQADSPISEFVTFDSFLTNSELNALTQ